MTFMLNVCKCLKEMLDRRPLHHMLLVFGITAYAKTAWTCRPAVTIILLGRGVCVSSCFYIMFQDI